MYTFITFGIICFIQSVFIWIKISEIKDYKEMIETFGTSILGMTKEEYLSSNKYYSASVRFFAYLWRNFKKVLIIPIMFILFINFVISLILGGVLSLIF